MIRFDILMKNYTGKDMKVALIDNGVKGHLDEATSVDENLHHASICAKIIQAVATSVKLMDFKASSNNKVSESSLINCLYSAIAEKPDIINISIGFNCCSKELRTAIQKAVESGIIIVAAKNSKNVITYPASISGVIEVGMIDDKNTNKIAEIFDHEFVINKNCIPLVGKYKVQGTSYACAFCTALIALIIESRPFIDRNRLLDAEYKQYKNSEIAPVNSIERQVKKISPNIALYCDQILGFDIKHYSKYLSPSINQFFDSENHSFIPCNGELDETLDIQCILLINPHEYPYIKDLWDRAKEIPTQIFIGVYNNMEERTVDLLGNEYLHKHSSTLANKIDEIETPVVMIGGFGCNSNKFPLLLELVRSFVEDNYNISVITYNPLGVAFDFTTFLYPKVVNFPDIVYSVNQTIINLLHKQQPDALLIDCPGSLSRVEADNSNISSSDYGQLPLAYLNAVQIDTFVLSIPIGVKLQEIQRAIAEIVNKGVTNIVLVVAPIQLLPNNVPRDFTDYIYADEEKQEKYYNAIKRIFPQYTCLKLAQLKEKLFGEVTSIM